MLNNEESGRDSSERRNHHLDMENKSYSKKTFSSTLELIELRNKYPNNPIIGYLNINLLRNKIIDFREIMSKALLDIVSTDETKYYHFSPFWRDRNSEDGGKLVFVKNGLIDLETKVSETKCIELKTKKKK